MVFGSGKRMCIGLHIAELEIKKIIPVVIRDFDVNPPDFAVPVLRGLLTFVIDEFCKP